MPNPLKDQIKTDIEQAKKAGQLSSGRIREIVQSAVSQVASEAQAAIFRAN